MYAEILNDKCIELIVDAPKDLPELEKMKKILKERGLEIKGTYNALFLKVDKIYFIENFLWLINEKPKIEIFLQDSRVTVEDKYYKKEYEFTFK